uniref:RING-type domain-containing protein n=2 Tax=Steinernema glaseri TaxID=37863 RepID=A0A1I7Z5V8_9BILA
MTDRAHPDDRNISAGAGNPASSNAGSPAGDWYPGFVQQTMNEYAGSADIGRGGDEFFRHLRTVGNAFLSRHQTSPNPQTSRDHNVFFAEQGLAGSSAARPSNHTGAGLNARRSTDSTSGVTVIDVDMGSPSSLINQTDELSDIDGEDVNDNEEEVDYSTREGLIRGLRRVSQRMNQPDTPIYCLLYIAVFIPFLLLVLLKNILDSIYQSIAFLIIVVGHIFMSQLFSESGTHGVKFWIMMGLSLFTTFETLVHMESLSFLKDSLIFLTVPKSDAEATFASILYVVIVTSYMAKTAFTIFKLAVSVTPVFSEKRKRRLYQWLEYTCIMYCNLLPFPQWLRYFNNVFFFILYILLKFCLSSKMIRCWVLNTKCLFRLSTIGTIPTTEEIAKDDHCSICCSTFSQPIKLSCNHLFCEDCVTTWLDKQDTCPICRQKVTTEDNNYKNGESQLFPTFY